MSEVPHYVLYEHAVGYALLKVKEFEDAGLIIPEVDSSIGDVQKFGGIVKLCAFDPFKNTEAALENCNAISDGLAHPDLVAFLENNLPKKKKKVVLGINDSKLAGSLNEVFPEMKLVFGGVITEILRGIRVHFAVLAKDLPHHSLAKAQLSLGHSYSRGKVKFDVHRVDNMVIQSIALLDQLDKDINLFGMRMREWYAFHFPELFKICSDQYKYARLAVAILDRNKALEQEDLLEKITEIVDGDAEKAAEIVEAARTSMGMDISDMDLANIERFATRVAALSEYRSNLHNYIKDRMNSCAPSLSALIGEQVGARLISHAGSLTNLAKYPASTVQILGAEKALFRALKTRSATPKYGLLFHSPFIGRASAKNKGRISRFLANKCTIASRIDCFSDVPVATYGEFLKGQVEERLKYFETGTVPQKNVEVMVKAQEEAKGAQEKVMKKRKKAAKKAKKIQEGGADTTAEASILEEIACVGPLVYTVVHKGCPGFTMPTTALITGFLGLACLCQLGLVFFWKDTFSVGAASYSIALYLLLFGLAVVNAISNVLFMPFMAQFHTAYLNAYFVGMGFSALVPSLLSLIQGTSNYECEMVDGSLQPHYLPPRFSVAVFFLIVFLWTILATISFIILVKKDVHKSSSRDEKHSAHEGTPLNETQPLSGEVSGEATVSSPSSPSTSSGFSGASYAFILVATALVNAQMNGVIPSIQSYAALPYSQATYHYGIALSNVVSPLASFLPFFVSVKSLPVLGVLTVLSSLVTAFIVFLASLSPNLIFDSATAGSALSICSALLAAGLHSYLRVVFASLLREGKQSESRLFWCGVFIQIGSFIGSAVMFPLVNVAMLFSPAPACRS